MSKRKSTPVQTETLDLTFPARFFNDHKGRDLPAGTVVKDGARQVVATVTPGDLAEITSDALFYSDHKHFSPVDQFMWGIIDSARNTVPSLLRQLSVLSSNPETGAQAEPFWQAMFDAHVKAGVTPIGPSPFAVNGAVTQFAAELNSPEGKAALESIISDQVDPAPEVGDVNPEAAAAEAAEAKRIKRNEAAKARRAAKKAQA